ncbi:MAG: tetratricopeptide repeat protein [Dinghuibacter sp.]|nr:tetratricopeptide repeat protein [Dinghuibacter sp.]
MVRRFINTLLLGCSCVTPLMLPAQTTPNNSYITALQKKGDSLYTASNWSEALKVYEEVAAVQPGISNPLFWNRAGYAAQQNSDHRKAVQYYEQALHSSPPPPLLPFIESGISRAYAMLNEKEIALQYIGKAIGSGYVNVAEMRTHKDFDSIRNDERFKELYTGLLLRVQPCAADARYNEFDFWVGSWQVFQTGSNYKVGVNTIEKSAGNCVLVESWESVTGGETGKSLTYINPRSGMWEQTYIGSRGRVTVYSNGVFKDSVMQFSYEKKLKPGKKVTGRFLFRILNNGDVRQWQEESDNNGKTWKELFNFIYRRKKPVM